jgi:L,D-peptidoglycan transpeptidase YkuD (ErfK/YbiS/YcfS/YnhG family)
LLITVENRQYFFERHFTPAESLFIRAGQSALRAIRVADETRTQKRQYLDSALADLQVRLAGYQDEVKMHLAQIPLRQALTNAELKVSAAVESFGNAPLDQTAVAVRAADSALVDLGERLGREWVDGHELALSRRMIDETIRWSRTTDSTALVVVKTDRRAYVVRDGRIISKYPVELGYRSWRQKLRSGDGATPEGTYRITQWRNHGSRYYKALVINYPNDSDRRRFEKNRKTGVIPRGARIGGNIEIHGEGGRGRDWTEGCVALANRDMDSLMNQMRVGDRVTIVRDADGWPQ